MKTLPSILTTLAGVVVAAGCAAPASHVDLPARNPVWMDTGAPLAMEQVTRYYVDEKGILWDHHGRKQESAKPFSPATPQ